MSSGEIHKNDATPEDVVAAVESGMKVYDSHKSFENRVITGNWDIEVLSHELDLYSEKQNIVGVYGVWFISSELARRYQNIVDYEVLTDEQKVTYQQTADGYKQLAMTAAARGYMSSGGMFPGYPEIKNG